uniref:YqaJ viral recombinase domain-containing protein n=1 Tax=Nothobranchius kuhntae TaxID=321403 RepID=A0A1A8HSF9_NOTKU
MIRGSTRQTAAMRRGLQQETEVLASYAELMRVNMLPVGLVILPEAPHLGALPDGRIYDPTESPPFGLVEVKCTTKSNASQVAHLKDDGGNVILRQSHGYYWQVQGQLAVTGLEWCAFVTETNVYIQRIWRDNGFIIQMKQKLYLFYECVLKITLNVMERLFG